jgi:hypothetical protein
MLNIVVLNEAGSKNGASDAIEFMVGLDFVGE